MNRQKELIKKLPKWDKVVLKHEIELIKTYGLRNKKELQRIYYKIAKIRRVPEGRDQVMMLDSLIRLGVLAEGDSVLSINVKGFLTRRLQTIVSAKFGISLKQSRQLITHGHVRMQGVRVRPSPSQLINLEDEKLIEIVASFVEPNKNKSLDKKEKELD